MEYTYKVYDQNMDVLQGKIKSPNMNQAKLELQSRGYRIIHIQEIRQLKWKHGPSVKFRVDEMSLLFQEMALYIEAGMEIHLILNLVSENYKGTKKRKILEIKDKLEQGEAFSRAMEDSELFPAMVPSMIVVGEMNSRLEKIFRDLARQFERESKLRKKFIQALAYPVILICTSLMVVQLIMKFVLPMFLEIFSSSKVELPWMTRVLISMANHFDQYGVLYMIFLLILLILLFISMRNKGLKYKLDQFIYTRKHLFFLYRVRFQLFFLQSIYLQISNGMTILSALENCKSLTQNSYLHHRIDDIISLLRMGTSFSDALNRVEILPNRIVYLLRSGEISSALIDSFTIGIKILDQQLEDQAQKVQTYLEPTLIILISLFVGFIVLSIAIPMFDLVNQF